MVAPSKIRNNAIELNKIQYIDGNNRINFTTDVYSNGSPIADATAGSYANSGLLQANSAYGVANSAALYANGSFAQANAAFNSANNVAPQIQPAFDTANSAALYANGAFIQSNTKLSSSGGTVNGDLAITGNLIVSGSRIEINTATVLLNDNIVTINSDLPTNIAPTENAGIEINRGSSPNVALLWNENTDSWTFTNDGTNYEQLGGGSAGSYANSAFIKANAAFATLNTASSWSVRQSFKATAGQTSFTISSGYLVGYIDVYYNGLKLYDTEDYTATDSLNVVLSSSAQANDIIEVVGLKANVPINELTTLSSSITGTVTRQTFFANNGQTTFTTSTPYRAGYLDVFYNGLKLNIPNDVVASDGANVTFTGLTPALNDVIEVVGVTPNISLVNAIPITGGSVSGGLTLAGNVLPSSTNTYYLGSDTQRWHSLFVGPGSIDLGGLILSNSGGTLAVSTPGAPATPLAGEDTWVRAQANAAFNTANNVGPQIAPAFNAANSASLYANGAFTKANSGVQYGANTSSNSFIAVPIGTTAERPASPSNGSLRLNTTTNNLEMYFSGWRNVFYTGYVDAIGGTISYSGNYKIHTFTGSGTFSVTSIATATPVEYLVVAGGGGGGGRHGGGGGAGGVVYASSYVNFVAGNYPITVGAGATGAQSDTIGGNGSNSAISGIDTGVGGGGGGSYGGGGAPPGQKGGSGGGGGHAPSTGAAANQISSLYGTVYGNAGGNGASNEGGGGGGAGGAGTAGIGETAAGPGGAGILNSITGIAYYWAGGGGGAGWTQTAGNGGIGGGGGGGRGDSSGPAGTGGDTALNPGSNGVGGTSGAVNGGAGGTNTGGGGGGSGQRDHPGYSGVGGNGGSGIVIIRYRYQ
jgi:hypothetical protein